MKKRILSLLLVICMIVGMLPMVVLAEDVEVSDRVWFGGRTSTSTMSVYLTPGQVRYLYTIDGYMANNNAEGVAASAEDYNLKVEFPDNGTNTVKIYLKNAYINNVFGADGFVIGGGYDNGGNYYEYAAEVIVEADSHLISNTNNAAFKSTVTKGTTITSVNGAKLTVQGTTTGTPGMQASQGSLKFKDANVFLDTAYRGNAALWVKGSELRLDNSTVVIENGEAGVEAGPAIRLSDAPGNTANAAGTPKRNIYIQNGSVLKTSHYADNNRSIWFDGECYIDNSTVYAEAPTYTFAKIPHVTGAAVAEYKTYASSAWSPLSSHPNAAGETVNAYTAAVRIVAADQVALFGYADQTSDDASAAMATVTMYPGDDSIYFVATEADGNGLSVLTRTGATADNYTAKLEYPLSGLPTLYLNGIKLKNAAPFYFSNGTNGTATPWNIVVEDASKVESTTFQFPPLFSRTTGDVTVTSVNNAKLTLVGNSYSGKGNITAFGNLILKNANVDLGVNGAWPQDLGVVITGGDLIVDASTFRVALNMTSESSNDIAEAITIKKDANGKGGNFIIKNGSNVFVANDVTNDLILTDGDTKIIDSEVTFGTNYSTSQTVFQKAPDLELTEGKYYVWASTTVPTLDRVNLTLTPKADTDVPYNEKDAASYVYFAIIHNCDYETVDVYEEIADCSESQYKVTKCAMCGKELKRVETEVPTPPTTDHIAGTPVEEERVDATTSAAGYYVMNTYCTECGKLMNTETVPIPKIIAANWIFRTTGGSSLYPSLQPGNNTYEYKTVDGYVVACEEGEDYNIKLEYKVGGIPTMYLKGAVINSDLGILFGASNNVSEAPLNIVVETASSINVTATNAPAIDLYTTGDVTISGSAKLTVSTRREGNDGAIAARAGNLILDNANIHLTDDGSYMARNYLIYVVGGDLTVNGGKLFMESLNDSGSERSTHGAILVKADAAGKGGNITVQNGADVDIYVIPITNQWAWRTSDDLIDATGTITFADSDIEIAVINQYRAGYTVFNKAPVLEYTNDYTASGIVHVANSGTIKNTWDGETLTIDGTPVDYDGLEAADQANLIYFKITHCHVGGETVIEKSGAACEQYENRVKYCIYCGEVASSEQVQIDGYTGETAHTPGEAVEVERVNATTTAEGYYVVETRCDVCGDVISSVKTTIPVQKVAYFTYITKGYRDQSGVGKNITMLPGDDTLYFTNEAVDPAHPNNTYLVATDDTVKYNVKIEYPELGVVTVYLKDANLVNDVPIVFGSADYADTPINIVVEEASYIRGTQDNGAVYGAIDLNTTADVNISSVNDAMLHLKGTKYNAPKGVLVSKGNINLTNANLLVTFDTPNPATNGINLTGTLTLDNSTAIIWGPTVDEEGKGSNEDVLSAIIADKVIVKNSSMLKALVDQSEVCVSAPSGLEIYDTSYVEIATAWTTGFAVAGPITMDLDKNTEFVVRASMDTPAYDSDAHTMTAPKDWIDAEYDDEKSGLYRYFNVMPHEHEFEVITHAPTCTEDGYDVATCWCGYETGEKTNINTNRAPHWSTEAGIHEDPIPATCTSPAMIRVTKYCAVCDVCYYDESTVVEGSEPLGHAADATYTDMGDDTHMVECSVCGVAFEEHTYVDGECVCGAAEEKTDDSLVVYTSASNPTGAGLQLADDIRAVFQVKTPTGSTYDRIFLRITKEGETTDVETTVTGTWLRFVYVVPAPHMTKEITVTVMAEKDGEEYRGQTMSFTIRQSAEAMLDSLFPNYQNTYKNCDLLANMLNYGAKAQQAFHVDEDNLATKDLPAEYMALILDTDPAMEDAPTVNETGKAAKLYNISVQLQEKVKAVGNFSISSGFTAAEDYHIEIQHVKSNGDIATYIINSDEFTVSGSGTKYIRFVFDKIAPSQLRDEMRITLYQNDVAVSATYSRSMCMIMKPYATNAAYSELIPAIMKYADCAKVAFG